MMTSTQQRKKNLRKVWSIVLALSAAIMVTVGPGAGANTNRNESVMMFPNVSGSNLEKKK